MSIYLPYIFLLFGVVFLFLYLKERQRRHFDKKFGEKSQSIIERQLEEVNQTKNHYLEEKIDLSKRLVEQQVVNVNLQKKLEEQLQQQKQLTEENRLQFENLSNRLFEEKASKFTKQNQENLDQLLKPLQERIKDFEKKVEETYQRESNERFSLKNELRRTLELNRTLSRQADNLTKALKSDSKSQGNWGEYLLEKVLDASGLQEGLHYKRQVTIKGENGKILRPDIVLYLPEEKHVIIDSKVSLTAYERYFTAEDPLEKQTALRDHITSFKKHIDELSSKKYERFFDRAPDFVLMFVPIEPAYNLALMKSPQLYEEAFRKKVILVSISSLMATLRIIESVWRLEKQNKNASQIIEEGNKLYDKLVGFVTDMENIGQKLSGAQTAYDQAMNKVSTGKGNLIRRAEKMKSLGLNPSKELPAESEDSSMR